MKLEICAFNLPAALAAERAGADRIEFCAGPEEGGVTPSAGLIRVTRDLIRVPLYPIIRPREGDFLYTDEEFRVMLGDLKLCREMGCDGVVIGMLLADGSVDVGRCARLVETAYPMGVTFHRAFDRAANPFEALEAVIGIGCERILTSGQRPVAMEGAQLIAELVRQADDRIIIMPGSGVRASTIGELARATGAVEFHTSARVGRASAMEFVNGGMEEELTVVMPDGDEVRLVRQELVRLDSGGGVI
jgi:copper homeostasis protein